MSEPLLFAREGGFATLTLNRPTVGNTIDLALAKALLDAAIRYDQDDGIRCLVPTGAGNCSAAGAVSAASPPRAAASRDISVNSPASSMWRYPG